MSTPRVQFAGDSLAVGASRFRLAHPIDDAVDLDEFIVVLFSPDSATAHVGQFANLVAVDPATGEQLWEADLPTTTTGDCYYKIASRDPLVAYSVKSYVCTIDRVNGRIVDKEFVK